MLGVLFPEILAVKGIDNMEFLVNAVMSDGEEHRLLGVVIVHFDPTEYTGRAKVELLSIAEFAEKYKDMTPSGFNCGENGALLSDTVMRRAIASSVFSYMEEELSKIGHRELDIVDLVLFGVENKGYVIANYGRISEEESYDLNGIYIPFKSFKVSNSSFNIYASYKDADDSFKTFSLLNVEDGSKKPFAVAFPAETDLSQFEGLEVQQILNLSGRDYILYTVDMGLVPFYASVGEGFLNYLAYNVAFYNIGEKTLKELAPETETIVPSVQKSSDYIPRKPKVNVAIEHVYKESQLKTIVSLLQNKEQLFEFLNTNPEASVTYYWIQKAYNSPWFKDNMDKPECSEGDLLATSCSNLLIDCKMMRLKFALELLAHRYYIYSMGMINDNLNVVLRGGGVGGETVKRSNFGYY